MRARRQFTDEFEAGAVRLVLDEFERRIPGGGLSPCDSVPATNIAWRPATRVTWIAAGLSARGEPT